MDDGDLVGALHRLSSGEPPESGDVPIGVLGVGADVDQVDGLGRPAFHQRVQRGYVYIADSVLLHELVGELLSGGYALVCGIRQVEPVRAVLKLVPGEYPSGGAVFESDDVLDAHALEQPGADDAPRATSAVDNDRRVVVHLAKYVADVQRQLAVRDAATAGNAVALVLLWRARVEDHHLVASVHPAPKLDGIDLGYVVLDLYLLAEVLAGHVDAPLSGTPLGYPSCHASTHRHGVAVAETSERLGGEGGATSVVVAQDDRCVRVWDGVDDAELKLPARDQARSDDVRGVVLARFPDVNQSEGLVAGEKVGNFGAGDGWWHGSSPRLSGTVMDL